MHRIVSLNGHFQLFLGSVAIVEITRQLGVMGFNHIVLLTQTVFGGDKIVEFGLQRIDLIARVGDLGDELFGFRQKLLFFGLCYQRNVE